MGVEQGGDKQVCVWIFVGCEWIYIADERRSSGEIFIFGSKKRFSGSMLGCVMCRNRSDVAAPSPVVL